MERITWKMLENSSGHYNILDHFTLGNFTCVSDASTVDVGACGNYVDSSNSTLTARVNTANIRRGSSMRLKVLLTCLQLYYTPVLVTAGLLGNCLSIYIMCQNAKVRRLSCTVYLIAIAISNATYLLAFFLIWLGTTHGVRIHNQPVWCQALTLLSGVANFLSCWYVLLLSLDRLLAVGGYPRARARLCSPMCAKLVTLILGLFSIAVYVNISLLFAVVQFLPGTYYCAPLPERFEVIKILSKIDVFWNAFLPYMLILVFNICSYSAFSRLNRCRKSFLSVHYMTTQGRRVHLHIPMVELNATRACFVLCLCNLSLCVPCQVLRVYHTARTSIDGDFQPSAKLYLTQELFQYLYNTSFAVHIFIYVLTLPLFRASLVFLAKQSCSRVLPSSCIQKPIDPVSIELRRSVRRRVNDTYLL